jgi:Fe-S cluster assembly iron-binding protein IscA
LSANDAFCKNITLQSSVRANSLTGNSLTITNVLTATTSNVTINRATTINNILTAATDSVHIAKPTTIDSTLTITGDTFTISNANAKIQFGTTADAKSSLSYNTTSKAFVMSGLII